MLGESNEVLARNECFPSLPYVEATKVISVVAINTLVASQIITRSDRVLCPRAVPSNFSLELINIFSSHTGLSFLSRSHGPSVLKVIFKCWSRASELDQQVKELAARLTTWVQSHKVEGEN